jgi:hypothetical protein
MSVLSDHLRLKRNEELWQEAIRYGASPLFAIVGTLPVVPTIIESTAVVLEDRKALPSPKEVRS